MSKTQRLGDKPDDGSSRVLAAFDAISAFHENGLSALNFKNEHIEQAAEEEIAGKHIVFDVNGFSAGMRKAIIRPIHDFDGQWADLRNKFGVAIQPFRAGIDALGEVGGKIADLERKEDEDLAEVDEFANLSQVHKRVEAEHNEANAQYNLIYEEEGGRLPTTYANHLIYWVALFGIGVAEWFINYDIIMRFVGIQIVAIGLTLVVGVALAFAAHAHGTVLKQWNELFADSKTKKQKSAAWRYLSLANFSALLVFGFAGATRYSVALDLARSFSQPTIDLGGPTLTGPSPLGEVGITLVGNVAAWAVGVFVAYLCHDRLQSYMDAAKRKRKADAAYEKLQEEFLHEKRRIKSESNENATKEHNRAKVKFGSVAAIKDMELQVLAYDEAFKAAISAKGNVAARAYLDDLITLARKPNVDVEFSNSSGALDIVAVQKIVPAFQKAAFSVNADA